MEPIAIIGIGCRFPGADHVEAFWRLLRDGVDAITEVPPARWSLDDFYDPNPETPGKTDTRWGGFLKDVDKFDPSFFRINADEARRMDPQHRLLLEVVWEALEDAGQTRERLNGTPCGVFIGMSNNDYAHIQLRKHNLIDAQLGSGSTAGMAPNRVSYFLNLQGPSLIVDTQCSSSLVAVHLACQSLWTGESAPLAIAGGVNVILLPQTDIMYTKSKLTAPDGRCKAFDARADGIVRGEGAGVVILKRWSQAISDGDPIYCVIRGSAVNQRGRTNGLTAPSQWSQMAVLRAAYRQADVSPGQVQYVEAHGTGTSIGDAIEAAALGAVLSVERPAGQRCAIGSVKTNCGHLEAAGGIIGLIKTALMMKHRELPPSLHFQRPNPYIPFNDLPLRVQQVLEPWPDAQSGPALAGVSSFGLGGTNAHVVLEESTPVADSQRAASELVCDESYLFSLSAHNPAALHALARAYREFLGGEGLSREISLKDFCYTASVRRSQHDHRLAFPVRSWEEMTEYLEAFSRGERRPGLSSGHVVPSRCPKLAFVFSGEGSLQWLSAGQGLWRDEPLYRATIEECDGLFSRLAGRSLLEELTADASRSRSDQTEVAQPVIFALQVALAALWRSWGIEPDAVVGESVGEVAAAHVAGALSLADALRVVFHRESLTQQATGHGPHMEPVESQPAEAIKTIEPRPAAIPIYSTMTGRNLEGREFDASYWERQMRKPVRFAAAAVDALIADGFRAFLELDPHPALSGTITQRFVEHDLEGTVLASLRRGQPVRETMLQSLGALYCLVRTVRWEKLYPADAGCVRLPPYAWQRERFWLTEQDGVEDQAGEQAASSEQHSPEPPAVVVEQTDFIDRLRNSTPEQRRHLLTTRIQAEVARIMGFKASQLPDIHENLLDAGMGSLMAVELGSSLKDSLEQDFPITAMFEYQTIDALSSFLLTEVLAFGPPAAGPDTEIPDHASGPEQQLELQTERIVPEKAYKG